MKILWHSNAPFVNTGYGQQTAVFTPRLKALGHDVAVSAFWGLGGSALDWEGIHVYPSDENWGNRTLPKLADHHGRGEPCLVITLMDVWALNGPAIPTIPSLASWVPVDHDPCPPKVIDFFERTGSRPIAMSRFGERKLAEAGLDPLYVPHGVDTGVFRPRDTRREVRDLLGIPQDAFVVGMVAANKGVSPPRKAFPQVFQAFARLHAERPDAILYLHTELAGNQAGINLGALAAACGLPPEAIKYTPPWQYELGVTQEDLSHLYGAMDVLANPAYGEGFGIPIVEAQACGVPVIATDFSAMTELCGAGWLVGGDPWYDATQGSFYRCPSVDDIHMAMLAAYDARGDQALRDRAVEFAADYDADLVLDRYWRTVLERLDPTHQPERVALRAEPWLSGRISTNGRIALDVGANVGDFTVALTGFKQVHAFEPHPDAARTIRARLGGAKGRRVVEAAVAASPGEITLRTYGDSAHTSAYGDSDLDTLTRGPQAGEITVKAVTLDGLGYQDRPVDLVKVDVEGLECEVLKGAERTLRAQRPELLIEIHSAANGEWCRDFLTGLGYEVVRVKHPHPGVPAGHHWLHAPRPVPAVLPAPA